MKKVLLLLSIGMTFSAHAAVEHRAQGWWLVFAQGKLGPYARAFFEVQPRFILAPNAKIDALIFRGALGAEVTKGLSLWMGVAWTPAWSTPAIDSVSANEGRLYQQVTYAHVWDTLTLTFRFRFEERLISNVGGMLFRPRLMVRAAWKFLKSPELQLAVQNEIFFNLNQRKTGPPAGFDQNRAYVGFGYWPTPKLLLEIGYQFQLLRRRTNLVPIGGHTVLLTTAYNF